MTEPKTVDIAIIGGGVNGAGIARDAAGRGLSVALVEKDDLAQGTSSRSSKLVHGGLRYLEHYAFRLVREALVEREVLLASAGHIIHPMRFVLPHSPADRPAWFIRLGLFIYDTLAGRRTLPGTRTLDLRRDPEGAPLQDLYRKGFAYSDCWVDDARLVVLNALDAAEKGAAIHTRTRCETAKAENGLWTLTLRAPDGTQTVLHAKTLVNAAGPWVDEVSGAVLGADAAPRVRLVKGSHILVEKFWDGPHAYIVQNHDKRVVFAVPYEGDKALIGTTDVPYDGHPEDVAASDAEIDYLIAAANRYFTHTLSRAEIIATFSGVRPLHDDGKGDPSAVTRDYVLDLDRTGPAPLLTVYGGKITTFRKLSEHAMEKLAPLFPEAGPNWTAEATLPGGDFPEADFARFAQDLRAAYPFLPAPLCDRYARLYGTRARTLLGSAASLDDLGHHFGAGLYAAEAEYLIATEWARTPDDILMRRTKLGLALTDAQKSALAQWLADRPGIASS